MAKHTVPVTSYVRFLGIAEVVFPQNAAWQNVDFLQLTADRSKASRGLPLGKSYYSMQAVERIRCSLDAQLSTQRVKHPQRT